MDYDRMSRDMKQRGIDARYAADERNRFAPMKALEYVKGLHLNTLVVVQMLELHTVCLETHYQQD